MSESRRIESGMLTVTRRLITLRNRECVARNVAHNRLGSKKVYTARALQDVLGEKHLRTLQKVMAISYGLNVLLATDQQINDRTCYAFWPQVLGRKSMWNKSLLRYLRLRHKAVGHIVRDACEALAYFQERPAGSFFTTVQIVEDLALRSNGERRSRRIYDVLNVAHGLGLLVWDPRNRVYQVAACTYALPASSAQQQKEQDEACRRQYPKRTRQPPRSVYDADQWVRESVAAEAVVDDTQDESPATKVRKLKTPPAQRPPAERRPLPTFEEWVEAYFARCIDYGEGVKWTWTW